MNRSHIHWPCLPLSEAFWFQEGPGVRKWQFTNSGIKLLNVGNIEKEGTLNLAKTDRHLSEEEVAKKYSHFLVDAIGDKLRKRGNCQGWYLDGSKIVRNLV